ncbi:MAG: tetratricopeptide repeat protein [Mycobacterium leprae]
MAFALLGVKDFLVSVLTGMLHERTREGLMLASRTVFEHFQGEQRPEDLELARVTRYAFLRAQLDLVEECLSVSTYRDQLLPHQRTWVEERRRMLERDIDEMPKLPEVAPPFDVDEAEELSLLAGGPDQAVEQLNARLLKAALLDTPDDQVPDAYRRLLATRLYEQMRRHFEEGLQESPSAGFSFQYRLIARLVQRVAAMTGQQAPVAGQELLPGAGERLIFAVPYQQNRLFTGRRNLLMRIHEGWEKPPSVQAIVGMSGLGKTELALQYAYQYRKDYRAVLWVKATDQATLDAEFAALADALGLQRQGQAGRERSVDQVREWLVQHDRWLLVVDDAYEAKVVEPYLPKPMSGHALVTSKNPDWKHLANVWTLEPWRIKESVLFLQRRTGQKDPAAAELAEAMGGLPLALDQAGAYISKTGVAIADYLQLFQDSAGPVGGQDSAPVSAAWTMAFDRVREEAGKQGRLMLGAVIGLMSGLAFLAPHAIPLDLIKRQMPHLPRRWAVMMADQDRLQQALAMLRRYSLIRVEAGNLEVHRLVQRTVREQMPKTAQQYWTRVTVQLMDALFHCNVHDSDTWESCHRFLPHALAAARVAQGYETAEPEAGALLNRVGYYLKMRTQLDAARRVLTSAFRLNRAFWGPGHPETALSLRYLGDTLGVLAKLEEACRYLEQALAIDKAVFGPVHITVGEDLNQLGVVLRRMGRYAESRAKLEEAMAVADTLGQTPLKAKTLHYMAQVLEQMDQSNWAAAKENYEKALAMGTKLYGQNDPFVATRRNNLALLLLRMGRPTEALTQSTQALAVHLTQYGRNHREVAADLNSIGLALRELGRRQEARSYFAWALEVARTVLDDQHPDVEQIRDNLRYMAEEEAKGGPAA